MQTGLKLYENMLIEGIDVAQEINNQSAPIFSVSLRELKIVGTAKTTLNRANFITAPQLKINPDGASSKIDPEALKQRAKEQKAADRAESTVKRGDAGKAVDITSSKNSLTSNPYESSQRDKSMLWSLFN